MRRRGVRLYAISVDPPVTSRRLKNHLKTSFTFLSDPDGILLDLLNIRHRGGGPGGGDIAFPTAFLIDEAGIVRWIYSSDTYRERARPAEIFQAIDMLGAG